MLGNSFFITNSSNPNTPAETWTLVYSKTTSGNYSYNAGWGKYKIVISGAGGAGGAGSAYHADYRNYANNGENGELKTIYKNLTKNDVLVFTGKVGKGGASSFADAMNNIATAGQPGTGYGNGSWGTTKVNPNPGWYYSAAAGGSGGGSTSFVVSGVVTQAAGGSGGAGSADEIGEAIPGGGGGGTPSNHNGSSGGTGVFGYKQTATSGVGSAGYVRIYKSNLKPEPL